MFAIARTALVAPCLFTVLLAPHSEAGDLVNFAAGGPEVLFDLPRDVIVREVATAEPLPHGERLLQIELPVGVLIHDGQVERVEEIRITIQPERRHAAPPLAVVDFAPQTTLHSELDGGIEVKRSEGSDESVSASLGGVLPVGGGTAHVTPSVTGGKGSSQSTTETLTRKAPLEAIVVSAPIDRRRGVLFKLRPSSQSTIEGVHRLSVTFAAPADWRDGDLVVQCAARGIRKLLWVEQEATWTRCTENVRMRLASHQAKPARHTVGKPIAIGPTSAPEVRELAERLGVDVNP